jgi:phage terminase large subunit
MFNAISQGKNTLAVIHRRAGKDVFCVEAWLYRGLSRVGTHVYLFPQLNQARSVIWNGMDYSGRPFLAGIPQCLVEYKNDARMEMRLINGSRLVLGGSNNFNALMGSNPVTIIYSEFALHHPLARQYLNPILIQNDGLEIVQSTPRGKNHLFELYETVRDNPRYHVEHLSVKDTIKHDGSPIITPEQIEEARRMGMSDEMVDQEFMCSFDVGNIGAYFTKEMAEIEREGRITVIPPDPRLPLHSVWDLGRADATAGWLYQIDGRHVNLLYLIHDNNKPLSFFMEQAEQVRKSMGLQWGTHWMPHDVKHQYQGWEQTESRLVQARKHGWQFQVTPKVNFADGIESLRFLLSKVRIHKLNCNLGIRAIREYAREFDEVKGIYSPNPTHNWTSHPIDALRYLAVNYKRLHLTPSTTSKYSYQG